MRRFLFKEVGCDTTGEIVVDPSEERIPFAEIKGTGSAAPPGDWLENVKNPSHLALQQALAVNSGLPYCMLWKNR
jgi:hypothetical protein